MLSSHGCLNLQMWKPGRTALTVLHTSSFFSTLVLHTFQSNFLNKAWYMWMCNEWKSFTSVKISSFCSHIWLRKETTNNHILLGNNIVPSTINTKSVDVLFEFMCCNKRWYAPVVHCKHSSQSQRTQVCVMRFSLINYYSMSKTIFSLIYLT